MKRLVSVPTGIAASADLVADWPQGVRFPALPARARALNVRTIRAVRRASRRTGWRLRACATASGSRADLGTDALVQAPSEALARLADRMVEALSA